MLNCPHRPQCEECKEIERSSAQVFARIAAALAVVFAIAAILFALDLDPRALAFVGFAGGCIFTWLYNRAEYRRLS